MVINLLNVLINVCLGTEIDLNSFIMNISDY